MHRGVASIVVPATGTEADEGEPLSSGITWSALSYVGGTSVLYMAVKQLANITKALIRRAAVQRKLRW